MAVTFPIVVDLSVEPCSMTSSGFGQKLVIADVGGPGNLFPKIHKEKEFDLKEICKACQSPFSFVFGPGAGPWKVVGRNCEMVSDANLTTAKVATKIASLPPGHSPPYKMDVIDSPKFNLMANLAMSEPGSGEVVHCKYSVRIGKDNFPETIRKALVKHYGESLGHYYYDTTPDTVAYEGWFTAAEKIYRIDEI
ncbi:unnamed protein product [Angiostrongylus costaricensis]|uniref:DUF1907 domain-containing protein n=1 Tax=Angiostrongylus costaricensis TaxID=334426 RepID=A0A0R3PRG0_ANGCS|nr:unnamed protein product [Angiostrongylus costaricensis]